MVSIRACKELILGAFERFLSRRRADARIVSLSVRRDTSTIRKTLILARHLPEPGRVASAPTVIIDATYNPMTERGLSGLHKICLTWTKDRRPSSRAELGVAYGYSNDLLVHALRSA